MISKVPSEAEARRALIPPHRILVWNSIEPCLFREGVLGKGVRFLGEGCLFQLPPSYQVPCSPPGHGGSRLAQASETLPVRSPQRAANGPLGLLLLPSATAAAPLLDDR